MKLSWESMKSSFQWISKIRKEGFSVLLTREYLIQMGTMLVTCFTLYQFQVFRQISSIVRAIVYFVILTTIPGFFAGLLTNSVDIAGSSIGSGTFLVFWAYYVSVAPEIFSRAGISVDTPTLVLLHVLIAIPLTILSFILCGVGYFCGIFSGGIGIRVRGIF